MDAVVEIAMDKELLDAVEELYRSMGTTFEEAVRMFARESIRVQGLPFQPTLEYLEDLTPQELECRMMQAEEDVNAGRVYTDAEFDAMMKERFQRGRTL